MIMLLSDRLGLRAFAVLIGMKREGFLKSKKWAVAVRHVNVGKPGRSARVREKRAE